MQENIRNRGGQPGNQNARTHGFYSRALTRAQLRKLPSVREIDGLDDEIAILRLKIESILVNDPQNTQVLMQALSLLSRLLQSKMRLNKASPNRMRESINRVLTDICIPAGIGHLVDDGNGKTRFSFGERRTKPSPQEDSFPEK